MLTAPTITEFRSFAELETEAVIAAAAQPQLGILAVASVLRKCGDEPHVFDVNSLYLDYAEQSKLEGEDRFADYVADLVIQSNADIYGLSSICSTYPLSLRIARSVKERRPYSMILFGGPQASVVDRATLEAFPCVDFVLRGEVEESLPILWRALHQDYDFATVGGLTFRENNTVKRNPNAPTIEDLDVAPSPAYDLSEYLQKASAASIELGRGCPFSCTFCSTNDFFRRRFRLRSPERVLTDMREISRTYGIRHFELVHDMFTVDRKRVVAFCQAMIDANEGFTWDCSARTDCVDEELLTLMARAGCAGLFYGIESGSYRVQRIIDKDLDPAWAKNVLLITQKLAMRSTASLIMGFPEEEWSDVRDTLEIYMLSARLPKSHPQINILAPLAFTPLHTQYRDEMVLEELCSDMSHQGLNQNPEDLQLIQEFRDIFPNFYSLPTPNLDRGHLLELREFLSATTESFRWLLCAIAQATDLLDFQVKWREYRITITGELVGGALRRYYVGRSFRRDFLRFVEQQSYVLGNAADALARAEILLFSTAERLGTSFRQAATSSKSLHEVPYIQSFGANWTGRIFDCPWRLDDIIQSVQSGGEPLTSERTHYAALGDGDKNGPLRLVEVSRWMAAAVNAYDGERSASEVWQYMAAELPEVPPQEQGRVFDALIKAGFVAGLISESPGIRSELSMA